MTDVSLGSQDPIPTSLRAELADRYVIDRKIGAGGMATVYIARDPKHGQFQFLGTAGDRKRYQVYDGGHSVPRAALISESLQWFDRYLGPIGNGR